MLYFFKKDLFYPKALLGLFFFFFFTKSVTKLKSVSPVALLEFNTLQPLKLETYPKLSGYKPLIRIIRMVVGRYSFSSSHE